MAGSRIRDPRRLALFAAATLTVALLAPTGVAAAPGTMHFVSDTSWTVTDNDPDIGPALSLPAGAQRVCLNASAPAACPADATLYGYAGGGWDADLSAIPGADWIWAPGIDGATAPADSDIYDFTKVIDVPGVPTGGMVHFTADDLAFVYVNGVLIGNSVSHSELATFDIGDALVEGENTIMIRAQNYVICGSSCSYASNPAGVVFGGTIDYDGASNGNGTPPPSSGDGTPPPSGSDGDDEPEITEPQTSTAGGGQTASGSPDRQLLLVLGGVALAMLLAAVAAGNRARSRLHD